MTQNEYRAYVISRMQHFCDLNYCIVALNGEAGEVAEWHKKHNLRGNPEGKLSDEDLKKELGDVRFYYEAICHLKGWTDDDITDANQEKLDDRVRRSVTVG